MTTSSIDTRDIEAVARAIHAVALAHEEDSLKPSGWDDECGEG